MHLVAELRLFSFRPHQFPEDDLRETSVAGKDEEVPDSRELLWRLLRYLSDGKCAGGENPHTLAVRPRRDFLQELLWYGRNIIVLKPESLRQEMIGILKDITKSYETG